MRTNIGPDGYRNMMTGFAQVAEREQATGLIDFIKAVTDIDGEDAAMGGAEPFEYYGTSRSTAAGWKNQMTRLSVRELLTSTPRTTSIFMTDRPTSSRRSNGSLSGWSNTYANEPPIVQCPVDAPIQVPGGKWMLILLFYLPQQPRRNGELRHLVPTITPKMLTQQLRELEADRIITRTVYDQVPPKVVYDITVGERPRLETVIAALCDWGLYWCDKTGATILATVGVLTNTN